MRGEKRREEKRREEKEKGGEKEKEKMKGKEKGKETEKEKQMLPTCTSFSTTYSLLTRAVVSMALDEWIRTPSV